MRSPAFQFYPGDYSSSQRVRLLTLEEEGAYINLLCSCWLHGSIPSDPEMAARLIGKGATTTLATTVLTMFRPSTEPGRMIHDRLEDERSKQASWREKSASGGRKSAELRKGGSRVVEGCLPFGTNQTSTLQSSVFSLQSSNNNTSTAAPAVLPFASEGFAKAWSEFKQHRLEIKAKLKPTGEAAALRKLAAMGETDAVAAMQAAVSNGWRGLFSPLASTTQKKPGGTSTYDLEAKTHGYTL